MAGDAKGAAGCSAASSAVAACQEVRESYAKRSYIGLPGKIRDRVLGVMRYMEPVTALQEPSAFC